LLYSLIKPFVELCLLRLTPQQLPASGLLLGITLAAHTVMGVLLSVQQLDAVNAIAAGFLDTFLLCGLTLAALSVQRLQHRAIKTLSALAGSGTLISLAAFPVSIWLHQSHASPGSVLLALILLGLIGWSITVAGHILRHALSAPWFVGLVIASAFYGISIVVLNTLFRGH